MDELATLREQVRRIQRELDAIKTGGVFHIRDHSVIVESLPASSIVMTDANKMLTAAATGALSPFLALPGLVGFWPMSSVQRSTGNVYDLSSQGRTLTYNGNPIFNYLANGVPYLAFDGTGGYLSRADETDMDVQGNEAIFSVPGLTFGGWFYVSSATAAGHMAGKASDANGPYFLWTSANGALLLFRVRDSTDAANTDVSITPTADAWLFVVCRYTPSTETKIRCNGVTATNTTSIPAAILNGTDVFGIGANGAGNNPITGRASLCFVCANALPDALIDSLFQQTRALFGV